MKKLLFLSAVVIASITACAQGDKSKRPSPPAKATETLTSGATVTIDYSQPSLKGRSVGKEVATYGQVWRTGANEPTTIEFSKDVTIDGKAVPAGKYSLWTVPGQDEWAVILSKEVPKWGTQYAEGKDHIRFNVKPGKAPSATEKLTFNIDKGGKVSLWWGETAVDFNVQ